MLGSGYQLGDIDPGVRCPFVKMLTQVKLMPEADQAAALSATLRTVNALADWVSEVAFAVWNAGVSPASLPPP